MFRGTKKAPTLSARLGFPGYSGAEYTVMLLGSESFGAFASRL